MSGAGWALLLTAGAVLAVPGRRRRATALPDAPVVHGDGGLPVEATGPAPRRPARPMGIRLLAVCAGVALGSVVGGPVGVALGLVTGGWLARTLGRIEPSQVRRRRERRLDQLPTVLDLVAVCLRAGMPLGPAVELVADAAGGPLAADLRSAAALQRLGASAERSWSGLRSDPALGPVARAVARSAESGSRLAAAFEALAADRRAEAVLSGEGRARRAGVLAMAPLGLCFLPAFVAVGVAPVVLSIAATVVGRNGIP